MILPQDIVEFTFETRNKSKNFWRKCIEQHTFFRGFKHVDQVFNRTSASLFVDDMKLIDVPDRDHNQRSDESRGKTERKEDDNGRKEEGKKHRSKSQFTRALFSRADRYYERSNQQRKFSQHQQFTPISQQLLFVSVRSLPSLDSYSYKDDTVDIDPIEDLISNQIKLKRNQFKRKESNQKDGDQLLDPKSERNDDIPCSKSSTNVNYYNSPPQIISASANVIADIESVSDYDSMELIAISQSQLRLNSQSIQHSLIERKREAEEWLRGKLDSIKDEIIKYNLTIHEPDDVDVLIKEEIREGRVFKRKKSIKLDYSISLDDDDVSSVEIENIVHKYTLSHPLFLYHLVVRSNLRRILLQ